jgi:hypothetical protein
MIRRALRTIRPGTQKNRCRSVLAWRRSGVSSGALPEAAAAGLMSHTQAQTFKASSEQHSHRRLAASLPDGRWRSAWPSLASLRRSSMYLP